MVKELKQWEDQLQKDKNKRDIIKERIESFESQITESNKFLDDALKARIVAQQVASETQQKLEYHISNIITIALSSVFPEPYQFSLKFVERRNKTEADFILTKNDNETDDLMASVGGGVIDIVSFALRCAIWSIKKTRNTIILDEPFRFLSRDLQSRASSMVKMISDKLGLQLIIISHIPELIDSADTLIEIKNKDGKSFVA